MDLVASKTFTVLTKVLFLIKMDYERQKIVYKNMLSLLLKRVTTYAVVQVFWPDQTTAGNH